MGSCLAWKERGCSIQNEGSIWLAITPPTPILSVGVWSWLASWTLQGEKVLEGLWPLSTSRQAPRDLGTLDAPRVHQSCNPSMSDVRQQMLLPVGSIYLATLDLTTTWRRCRDACNVKWKVKERLTCTNSHRHSLKHKTYRPTLTKTL